MGTIEKPKAGWRRFWPAALLLLLLLPAAICAQSILLILNGCDDLIHYNQPVDVTPLLNLQIPADMELPDAGFKLTPAIPTIEDEAVWIDARRMSNLDSARFEFDRLCERWPGDYTYGGDGDQRYCISHVRTDRADPAGLCGTLGHYSSHVVIQNQDLIFSISERSPDKKSQAKDEAIRQFAHGLETAIAVRLRPTIIRDGND